MKGLKLLVAGCMLAIAGTAMAEGYNRAGLTYNLGHYNFNKGMKDEAGFSGFCTNGFGLNYVHGFGLSESLPMYIEAGGELNFNFANKKIFEGSGITTNMLFQDINLNIPVNFTWHFEITDDITVAPYSGFSFKIHMMSREKYKVKGYDHKDESKWHSVYDKGKDAMDGDTWNRFQMAWQIGGNVIYKNKYTAGLEYGYDMIPAFNSTDEGENYHITNGTFKITLGYIF